MSTVAAHAPVVEESPPPQLYRFTVEQYELMTTAGVFSTFDRTELLEGWIVKKMTQHPPHAVAIEYFQEIVRPLLPDEWRVRDQKPIITGESNPEPDLTIVRGPTSRYATRHPRSADIALVVEVADTTIHEDRSRKGRIYARARIPIYWIVNVTDLQIEVYTHPKGGKSPAYRERRDYGPKETVPLILAGREVAQIPVQELLP
ncbi:MAG TPA: Uma2 family endonuclease [Gemmataceae bacterium]|nr:Uma2 family endonuclease [Gemmataceae bacterium]